MCHDHMYPYAKQELFATAKGRTTIRSRILVVESYGEVLTFTLQFYQNYLHLQHKYKLHADEIQYTCSCGFFTCLLVFTHSFMRFSS
jgi:hypothetical protein